MAGYESSDSDQEHEKRSRTGSLDFLNTLTGTALTRRASALSTTRSVRMNSEIGSIRSFKSIQQQQKKREKNSKLDSILYIFKCYNWRSRSTWSATSRRRLVQRDVHVHSGRGGFVSIDESGTSTDARRSNQRGARQKEARSVHHRNSSSISSSNHGHSCHDAEQHVRFGRWRWRKSPRRSTWSKTREY